MKNPRMFLFVDFDNTMMETEKYAVPSLIARFNQLYEGQISAPLTLEIFKENFHGQARETLCRNLSDFYGIDVSYADLYKDREWHVMQHLKSIHEQTGGLRMAPHLTETLGQLEKQGIVLSFVSNNPVQRAMAAMRYADNGQGDQLAAFFGTRFFEAGDIQKPDPTVYLRAMEQVGAVAAESYAIEDSVSGVTSAVKAGLTVIGFTGFSGAPAEDEKKLAAAGAAFVVQDWQQITQILTRSAQPPCRPSFERR